MRGKRVPHSVSKDNFLPLDKPDEKREDKKEKMAGGLFWPRVSPWHCLILSNHSTPCTCPVSLIREDNYCP